MTGTKTLSSRPPFSRSDPVPKIGASGEGSACACGVPRCWQPRLVCLAGALPAQIDYALSRLPSARQIKLYNSGSFFDGKAVPLKDHPAIAARVQPFERVILECHPALIGRSCLRFRDLLNGARLEIAMGLETAHPRVRISALAGKAKWLEKRSPGWKPALWHFRGNCPCPGSSR